MSFTVRLFDAGKKLTTWNSNPDLWFEVTRFAGLDLIPTWTQFYGRTESTVDLDDLPGPDITTILIRAQFGGQPDTIAQPEFRSMPSLMIIESPVFVVGVRSRVATGLDVRRVDRRALQIEVQHRNPKVAEECTVFCG